LETFFRWHAFFSTGTRVDRYIIEQMFRRSTPRLLCVECRRVNTHASGCHRPEPVRLGVTARVPRATAGRTAWLRFAAASAVAGLAELLGLAQ
jgi:hypothetical protein